MAIRTDHLTKAVLFKICYSYLNNEPDIPAKNRHISYLPKDLLPGTAIATTWLDENLKKVKQDPIFFGKPDFVYLY